MWLRWPKALVIASRDLLKPGGAQSLSLALYSLSRFDWLNKHRDSCTGRQVWRARILEIQELIKQDQSLMTDRLTGGRERERKRESE